MEQTPRRYFVDLAKYVDNRGERPVLRSKPALPVATVAYRALSGSWGLAELAYEFQINDVDVLAALLYYQQNCHDIDAQESDHQLEFEALD